MTSRRIFALAALLIPLISGCQSHLPTLETTPSYSADGAAHKQAPNINDIVNHTQCELATIINWSAANPPDPSRSDAKVWAAVDRDQRLHGLLHQLADNHFIATLQFTLEVADTEGLNPSLSFISPYAITSENRTISAGGQLTGTQDRSITISYTVDLAALKGSKNIATYCAKQDPTVAQTLGLTGALAGDLGLEDIVSDGLAAIDATSAENQYATAGPINPTVAQEVYLSGHLTDRNTDPTKRTRPSLHVKFVGGAVFTPSITGGANPWTVNLNGVATVTDSTNTDFQYMASWTGSTLPNDAFADGRTPLTLSGSLMERSNDLTAPLGFNPSVVLSGSVDAGHHPTQIELAGVVSPPGNQSLPSGTPNLTLSWDADLANQVARAAAAQGLGGGAGAAAKGGSAAAASGSTSFGSLITFTLIYGVNGGPNWTLTKFKGPAGSGSSGQLLNASRTNTDSLSITFVATCQGASPTAVNNYWQSIPTCSTFDPSQRQAAINAGLQNNLSMVLKSLSPSEFKQP